MKVVVNRCFGGFGLSNDAYLMLKEKGIPIKEYESPIADILYYVEDEESKKFRCNPILIEVVESLGEQADGDCASLEIIDIPYNSVDDSWYIDEYDGQETIREGRSW